MGAICSICSVSAGSVSAGSVCPWVGRSRSHLEASPTAEHLQPSLFQLLAVHKLAAAIAIDTCERIQARLDAQLDISLFEGHVDECIVGRLIRRLFRLEQKEHDFRIVAHKMRRVGPRGHRFDVLTAPVHD